MHKSAVSLGIVLTCDMHCTILTGAACIGQEITGEDEPEEKAKAAVGGLFGRAKRAAQVKACLLAEHLPPACSLFLWSALYLCIQKLL